VQQVAIPWINKGGYAVIEIDILALLIIALIGVIAGLLIGVSLTRPIYHQ
jgi:hypothetical protein